ncbi:hypothetical protein Bca52824_001295 [Brassica carinata]|uniref:Uncharacterized protein n=1 Tax=Brassica carinata TaxID=52824 RepID=A0A8X8BCK6_BRACI|nr:hypothetical protein Bca52824_001295 [Brassica carinata]
MGNITQESNVDCFDPSQDKQFDNPSVFSTPMTSFRPEILKRPFLTDIDDPEVRSSRPTASLMGTGVGTNSTTIFSSMEEVSFHIMVNLEIARVEKEMKQKLKIATVAMVVVGAIVGIWNSLTV